MNRWRSVWAVVAQSVWVYLNLLGSRLRIGGFLVQVPVQTKYERCSGVLYIMAKVLNPQMLT